jgi:hypothetical protein
MRAEREQMEYKWLDVAGWSFGQLHDLLAEYQQQGWQLDRITGPEEMHETALYGNSGALHLWLRRNKAAA